MNKSKRENDEFKKNIEEPKNNIENLKKQYTTFAEMIKFKSKQEEFNDRMVKATRKYQQIYNFEISNKKGHEYWNNEADAFKHTFGSALMVFEMGNLGSFAGGVYHELKTNRNPKGEWNMDSWNNNQGREIAKEIKKEYGELNFIKLPKEKQEDIIAHKVMVRMKNGDLITSPNNNDKKYFNIPENLIFDWKTNIEKRTDNNENNKANKNSSNWSIENHKAFLEGFDSGILGSGEKQKNNNKKDDSSNNSKKAHWTDKFNIGNPETDKGHWVTLDNGKHIFIKDT